MDDAVVRRGLQDIRDPGAFPRERDIGAVTVILDVNIRRLFNGQGGTVETAFPEIGVDIILLGNFRISSQRFPQVDAETGDAREGSGPCAADTVAASGGRDAGHGGAVIVGALHRPLILGGQGWIPAEIPA